MFVEVNWLATVCFPKTNGAVRAANRQALPVHRKSQCGYLGWMLERFAKGLTSTAFPHLCRSRLIAGQQQLSIATELDSHRKFSLVLFRILLLERSTLSHVATNIP